MIVGTLGTMYSWRTALMMVGAVGVTYAVFAGLRLESSYRTHIDTAGEQPSPETPGIRRALLQPGIPLMFAYFALLTMASKGIQTFTPIVAVDDFQLSTAAGNAALTGFFTVTAAGVLASGVLADRYDPRHVIIVFLTMAAVVTWVVSGAVVPIDGTSLLVLFGIIGGANGLVAASRDRLVSKLSAPGSTGRSFGFVFTGTALGGLISPAVLGAVIDVTTGSLAFALIGGVFFLSGLLTLPINRQSR